MTMPTSVEYHVSGFWVKPISGTWDDNLMTLDIGTTGNLTLLGNNLQPFSATATNGIPEHFLITSLAQQIGLSDIIVSVNVAEGGGAVSSPRFQVIFEGLAAATT